MLKVLIVDDAAFMRLSIKTMLEKNGFEVIGEAVDGQDGLNKYKVLKPDIVTMDITMPDVDGLQGLKLIKEYDKNSKVIMITSMGQESMVKQAILSGANGFLIKPFNEEVFINAIKKIC